MICHFLSLHLKLTTKIGRYQGIVEQNKASLNKTRMESTQIKLDENHKEKFSYNKVSR
jgi:hypothetical protein